MKQVRIVIVTLLLTASFALAQQKDNKGKPATPQAQPQTTGKHAPQAKNQEEYKAYVALVQMTDPAAMEKAADEFVAKYPDSELKAAVYQRAMVAYQGTGNDDKTMELGRKALSYNPDDPGVLVALSDMIAQRTRETDLDRDERLAEAVKMAQHSLETVGDYPAPQGMPPEQVAAVKSQMRGAAYAVIGIANFTQKKYPDAEAAFKQALDITKADPDPTVYLRLCLTLDKTNKYAEALEAANKTLTLVPADSQVAALATQEKTRLTQLLNKPAVPAKPATPPTSPAPVTPQ